MLDLICLIFEVNDFISGDRLHFMFLDGFAGELSKPSYPHWSSAKYSQIREVGLIPTLFNLAPSPWLWLSFLSLRGLSQEKNASNSWVGTDVRSSSIPLFKTHKRINKIPYIHLIEPKDQCIQIFPTKTSWGEPVLSFKHVQIHSLYALLSHESPGKKY